MKPCVSPFSTARLTFVIGRLAVRAGRRAALGRPPQIYRATRSRRSKPFGSVEPIAAITGFAEAPSISADGTTLYYHQMVGSEFKIETVTRTGNAPTITQVSPNRATAGVETPVTIIGTGLAGATSVEFGDAGAASFTQSSSTSIAAIAPAGAKGTVNVTVTTPNGTSAISKYDRFKYVR